MIDENEILFDKLYEQTQEYGRTQFIRLLMDKERHIKQLQERIERAIEYIEDELEWSEPNLDVCDMISLLKILKGDSNEM